METNEIEENLSLEKKIAIRAPRSLWLEFILHFSTLGVYTAFWFVARVREFNHLSKTDFTPWLWFLVPFFWFAQFFALPKFNKALNNLAEEHNLPKWNAWYGGWTLSVILITLKFYYL